MRAAMIGLALCALAAAGGAAHAQAMRLDGWWVVLASDPDTLPPAQMDARQARMRASLARCGLEPYSDFSSKFSTFRPGLMVHVLGAYASKAQAERVRAQALPCASGAYLKAARYAGE